MATYSSVKLAVAEAAGVGGSTDTYTSVDNLPTTGNDVGDQAFVSGNNRLYIWNGTGWYNIALINTNPAFDSSGTPESTYRLATDQSTTTITLLATDPEGLNITYSAVADSDFGGLATVSQDSSVFTITPFSKDSATTTTGNLTFKASDGVNIASAISEFTLTFEVKHSNHTTVLLKANGNNGTNTTITDASSNNHTITVVGNATAHPLSPYHPGGYSAYFDDVGDNILTNYSTGLFLSNDFTIECWFYAENRGGMILNHGGGSGIAWASFELVNQNDGINFAASSNNSGYDIGSETGATGRIGTIDVRTWNHLAVTREGNVYRGFVNGVQGYTQTLSLTPYNTNTRGLAIGSNYSNTWGSASNIASVIKGYLSDVRIVKGTALYTDDFAPPTERLTAVSGTTFLGCHLPYLADGSSSPHTLSITGDTDFQRFGPYDHEVYDVSSHGAGVRFDGSGDQLTIADDASVEFGSGDFTLELWYRGTDTDQYATLTAKGDGSFSSGNWSLMMNHTATGDVAFYAHEYSSSAPMLRTADVGISDNNWNHIAVVRYGNEWDLYINGVSKVSATSSITVNNNTSRVSIGKDHYYGRDLSGFISDYRIVKGTAVYTSNFTPPTAPLTAITNTSLLTCNSQPNIYDAAEGRSTLLVGNTKSSTAQTKNASSSVALDGTGDYVYTGRDAGHFLTYDFTVEGWWYFNTVSAGYQPLIALGQAADQQGWALITETDNELALYMSNGSSWTYNIGSTTVPNLNAWNHVAFVRNAGRLDLYLNGTQIGGNTSIGTNSTHTTTSGSLYIGHYPFFPGGARSFNGYIEDVRITKGLARYPFIPFDSTLTSTDSTDVLLCHASTIVDGSSNSRSITTTGDPTVSDFGPYPGMKSIAFDGNDHLNLTASALGTGNFSVEGWIWQSNYSASGYEQIFSFRPSNGSNANQGALAVNPSGGLIWYTNTFIIGTQSSGPQMTNNTWNHFALVRDSGTLNLFLNGSIAYSVSNTQDLSSTSLSIGANNNGTEPFTGNISNFRILSSTVQYSNSFTPPTTELLG